MAKWRLPAVGSVYDGEDARLRSLAAHAETKAISEPPANWVSRGLHSGTEASKRGAMARLDSVSLRWFKVGLRKTPKAELENMLRGYLLFSTDPGAVAALVVEVAARKRRANRSGRG